MNREFTVELKNRARAGLLGKWGFLAGVFLLDFFLNMILQDLVMTAFPYSAFGIAADGSIRFSIPGILCRVIVELFSTILSVGSAFLYLNLCRGRAFRISDLFFGFTHQPEHIVGYFAIMTAASALCFLLPSTFMGTILLSGNVLWIVGLVLAALACLALYYRITLSYVIFPCLYADTPWKSSRELLQESRRLMKGHRLRYFYLQLSFAGILLLGLLSLGIGMIWITPYVMATNTLFYLDLLSQEESGAGPEETASGEPF